MHCYACEETEAIEKNQGDVLPGVLRYTVFNAEDYERNQARMKAREQRA